MRSPASLATGRRRLNEPRKFSVAQHQRRASHVPATRPGLAGQPGPTQADQVGQQQVASGDGGLPVTPISQVTTICAVPPNAATPVA